MTANDGLANIAKDLHSANVKLRWLAARNARKLHEQDPSVLEELHVTEEELKRIFIDATKHWAAAGLKNVRENPRHILDPRMTAKFLRPLEAAGLTLTDIGSSDMELETLRFAVTKDDHQWYLTNASDMLKRLREREYGFDPRTTKTYGFEDIHAALMRLLREGNLTLTDIGSSDREISLLSRQNAADPATMLPLIAKVLVTFIRDERLTLGDIGLSAAEFDRLQRFSS